MDGTGSARKPWAAIAIAGLVTVAVATAPPARQDQPAREEREIPPAEAPPQPPVTLPDSAPPPVVLPPAIRATPGGGVAVVPAGAVGGVPALVFAAYRRAAAALAVTEPGCHLPVSLLAAIGKVESGHARNGRVDDTGTTSHPILGPTLDGSPGLAAISDTDGGRFDGDASWDRAVGPMQFIPGTWREWATDGNGDGDASPHNVFDASGAAARYLCTGGRDLATGPDVDAAILSYNNSASYLRIVRTWMAVYENGTVVVPGFTDMPGGVVPVADPAPHIPSAPPTDPAPPGTEEPTAPPTTTPPPPGSSAPPAPEPPVTTPPPTTPGDVLTGTVGGLVGGVVCVVGGVLDGATDLLGGLLGAPVTPAPGETCP